MLGFDADLDHKNYYLRSRDDRSPRERFRNGADFLRDLLVSQSDRKPSTRFFQDSQRRGHRSGISRGNLTAEAVDVAAGARPSDFDLCDARS